MHLAKKYENDNDNYSIQGYFLGVGQMAKMLPEANASDEEACKRQ